MSRWLVALLIATTLASITATGAISSGRIIEMGITNQQMATYFQQHASANDIARVDHPNDIGLIANITVGKKMVIFKSTSQIQQFLANNAGSLDIIGYNLEPGQQHDPTELADPVAAVKSVRVIASQYGKAVAVGLTHDLTLQYGAAMAPYADIWVLQIQRAQNEPAMAGEFVGQMVPALRKANPAIQIFVQIRTDSSPQALAQLVNGLGDVNVSILTQKQDTQDAIAVASAFFGSGSQQQSKPINFQPVAMPGGSEYGIRIPAKINGWYAPTASNLIGSDEKDHLKRGSINAWDFSTSYGSPVFAIGPGTIRYAGCNDAGHYGCWVSISHGNGLQSDYAHCATNSIKVSTGQQVDASTQLCNVGNTGWADWAHVHLAIKKDGVHQMISDFFDTGLVAYCHWTKCKATNDPNAPIAGMGSATTTQPAPVTPTENRLTQLLRALAQMPPEQLSSAIFMLVMGIGMALWLGGMWIRIVLVSAGSAMAGALAIAILLMPVAPVQATQQQAPVAGGDWEKAYQIVQGNEGWKCTEDGAHTMGGVTQGTYNRWRAKNGMGNADVCANLTREQAKLIFRDLFWIPVGAEKMPYPLALTVVDHYYVTGKVSHLLAQCGTDVKCFNDARVIDFRSKSNCNLYCAGWINRVNKVRKLTQQ